MADPKPRRRQATSAEGKENQMISLAMSVAEKQMKQNTASAQVITHFLKLGSSREKAEQERLQNENLLLSAKVDQLASAKRVEELYSKALEAMKEYSGKKTALEDDDY